MCGFTHLKLVLAPETHTLSLSFLSTVNTSRCYMVISVCHSSRLLSQSHCSDQHAAVLLHHLGSSRNMILISTEYSWISMQPCFKSDASGYVFLYPQKWDFLRSETEWQKSLLGSRFWYLDDYSDKTLPRDADVCARPWKAKRLSGLCSSMKRGKQKGGCAWSLSLTEALMKPWVALQRQLYRAVWSRNRFQYYFSGCICCTGCTQSHLCTFFFIVCGFFRFSCHFLFCLPLSPCLSWQIAQLIFSNEMPVIDWCGWKRGQG